jgi:hypothetical protein
MNLDEACEPNQSPETLRDVALILRVLKDKPLDYAKGVLRQAGIAAETLSVVSPAA